ncbi:hypothetical protein B0H14DRAFT_3513413 [Mycena olivaceomarginata]|nr:hypothetical protein B0H14DRAFT_3513413 [Mycena olivaceomarginata]
MPRDKSTIQYHAIMIFSTTRTTKIPVNVQQSAQKTTQTWRTTTTTRLCTPRILNRLPAWKPMILAILFGGAEKPRARKQSARAMAEEEVSMEELENAMKDDVPDDSAIEIDSDDEDRS